VFSMSSSCWSDSICLYSQSVTQPCSYHVFQF
jgi:hypothetical protein